MSDMQSATPQDNIKARPAPIAETLRVLWPVLLLGLAFAWLFQDTMVSMAERWQEDAFSHGWLIAPAVVAIVWIKRDTWLGRPAEHLNTGVVLVVAGLLMPMVADTVAMGFLSYLALPLVVGGMVMFGAWVRQEAWQGTAVRPANAGIAVIVFGLMLMVLAAWAEVMFIPYVAILVVLGGMLLFFLGWEWLRVLIFPYGFLYFMVPWPDFLVTKVSFPMQIMTSVYSAALAKLIGLPVTRDGVSLHIGPPVDAHFEVAVACSGMHSLIALMCLASLFAYFTPVALWKRWSLFAIGLPMALVANILRVFAILCVATWISKELAGKAFHDWSSPVLFLFNTMGLIALRNLMMRSTPLIALGGAPGDGAADDGSGDGHEAPFRAIADRTEEDDDAF